MNRKTKQHSLEEYKTTLILLTILLAVMSLVVFIPLKNNRKAETTNITSLSK